MNLYIHHCFDCFQELPEAEDDDEENDNGEYCDDNFNCIQELPEAEDDNEEYCDDKFDCIQELPEAEDDDEENDNEEYCEDNYDEESSDSARSVLR